MGQQGVKVIVSARTEREAAELPANCAAKVSKQRHLHWM